MCFVFTLAILVPIFASPNFREDITTRLTKYATSPRTSNFSANDVIVAAAIAN